MRKFLLSLMFIFLFNYVVQANVFEISKKDLSKSDLKVKIENSQEISKEIQNRLVTKENEVLRIPLDLVETYKNQNYDIIGYYDEGVYYIYNDFYYVLEKEFKSGKIMNWVNLLIPIICIMLVFIILTLQDLWIIDINGRILFIIIDAIAIIGVLSYIGIKYWVTNFL